MATLRPFRGCRFDPAVVGDLSDVVCPPYDMIGADLKLQLQQRSPYNAVHLEGGEQPDPVDPQAGYQQAARLFRQWMAEGAVLRDERPCFYLMRHSYEFAGARYQHLGFLPMFWWRITTPERCFRTSLPESLRCWTGWRC